MIDKKADQLWQGYPKDDEDQKQEEKFWETYEGLLKKQKEHKQVPAKKQWQEKYYFNPTHVRVNAISLTALFELTAILLCTTQPTSLLGYIFAGIIFIAVTIFNGAVLLSNFLYFAVNDSGLHFKDSVRHKGVNIEWDKIKKIEFFTEINEEQEQARMVIHLTDGILLEALDTHYNLPKADHHSFIKHLDARQIPYDDRS